LEAIGQFDSLAASRISQKGDTILLVGSGGREHALAVALADSPLVSRVICAPGNGGTDGGSGKIVNAACGDSKNETIVGLVKEYKVDMVVVGPEQPLVDGLVDCLAVECEGVRVFGPSKDAAELEASKVGLSFFCGSWVEFGFVVDMNTDCLVALGNSSCDCAVA
jgi:phosphoribosylamine-glycine ligase